MYRYSKGNIEHCIYPISESGYEPFGNCRGSFQAEDIMTTFDLTGMHPMYQRSTIKRFYFDTDGNVYASKTSNDSIFNLLHN